MKLIDIAKILRSKNAGPLYITFDIMFESREKMLFVKENLSRRAVAKAYNVSEESVDVIYYEIVNSIKITMPREHISGSVLDSDIYGCQMHMPLANIEIADYMEN